MTFLHDFPLTIDNYQPGGDRMKEPSKNKSADTDWEIDIQSCSATDCTGLIPALPESDAELEHYQDLYHYLPDEKK